MDATEDGAAAAGSWIQGARRERDLASATLAFLFAAGATLGLVVLLHGCE